MLYGSMLLINFLHKTFCCAIGNYQCLFFVHAVGFHSLHSKTLLHCHPYCLIIVPRWKLSFAILLFVENISYLFLVIVWALSIILICILTCIMGLYLALGDWWSIIVIQCQRSWIPFIVFDILWHIDGMVGKRIPIH